MKTSFINLSNQELRDFVEANSQLKTLVKEANFLDGNLKEESSKAKENTRTELGAFHSALALNHELTQSNKQEVLENVLKLMHNSAMRVVEIFEQIAKSNPEKVLDSKQTGADLVLSKDLFYKAVYYSIEQKDGKNITISLNKDPNKDSEYYDSYKIEYSDSLKPYTKVQTEPGKELRSTEESLKFFAQYKADHYKLESIKAHSCDQKKSTDVDYDTFVSNMIAILQAQEKAEKDIPLQRLDLHQDNQDTPYIKTLITTLEQKLESNE